MYKRTWLKPSPANRLKTSVRTYVRGVSYISVLLQLPITAAKASRNKVSIINSSIKIRNPMLRPRLLGSKSSKHPSRRQQASTWRTSLLTCQMTVQNIVIPRVNVLATAGPSMVWGVLVLFSGRRWCKLYSTENCHGVVVQWYPRKDNLYGLSSIIKSVGFYILQLCTDRIGN